MIKKQASLLPKGTAKDYSYNTTNGTFFGYEGNSFSKNDYLKKEQPINLVNKGILPNTNDIYIPQSKKVDIKDYQITIVNEDNFKEVTNEIYNYWLKHNKKIAISFDYESYPNYCIPIASINHLKKLFQIDIQLHHYYDVNDKMLSKLHPRIVKEQTEKYNNDVLNEILRQNDKLPLQEQIDINKFIVSNPDYTNEPNNLVYFKSSILFINIVGIVYGYNLPMQSSEVVTLLLKQKINLLDDNWFEIWLKKQFNKEDIQKTKNRLIKTNWEFFDNYFKNTDTANLSNQQVASSLIKQLLIQNQHKYSSLSEMFNKEFAFDTELLNAPSCYSKNDVNDLQPKFDTISAFNNFTTTTDETIIFDALSNFNYLFLKNNQINSSSKYFTDWSISKTRINRVINKMNALLPTKNKINLFSNYVNSYTYGVENEYDNSNVESNIAIMQSVFNHQFEENSNFIHWISIPLSSMVLYDNFLCGFCIENKIYTFIENEFLNSGVLKDNAEINLDSDVLTSNKTNVTTSLASYKDKANAKIMLNYFWLWGISMGINFKGVNSGSYDAIHIKANLVYENSYKGSYRALSRDKKLATYMMGGAVNSTWTYKGIDINKFWSDCEALNEFYPFLIQYSSDPFVAPLVNGNNFFHTDNVKESSSGATNEDMGKGLKEVEANYHTSVENNKGLSFSAKLPSEINATNWDATITYNAYDVINTLVIYSDVYQIQKQASKNALINLSGQGSNLFETKDKIVTKFLNKKIDKDYLDYSKKEENYFYAYVLKPIENALKNAEYNDNPLWDDDETKNKYQNDYTKYVLHQFNMLGIDYYLDLYVASAKIQKQLATNPNDKKLQSALKDIETKLSANYEVAMIGLIYRLTYWLANPKNNDLHNLLNKNSEFLWTKKILPKIANQTSNDVIFAEMSLVNDLHSYVSDYTFDYQKIKNTNGTIPNISNKDKVKMTNLWKRDDNVIIESEVITDGAKKQRATNGIIITNKKIISVLSKLRNDFIDALVKNQSISQINNFNTILEMYVKAQQSDSLLLAEQTKLKQTAIFESESAAQLGQIGALNGIDLSELNPLWTPKYKLNKNIEGVKRQIGNYLWDLHNPKYERVKYYYQTINRDDFELKPVQNEDDKPDRDLNQENAFAFKFETPIIFKENDLDGKRIKNVIDFFNAKKTYKDSEEVIYHYKDVKLLDTQRMQGAYYHNLKLASMSDFEEVDKYGYRIALSPYSNYLSGSFVWYEEMIKFGIDLMKNDKVYHISWDEFKNKDNWEIRVRKEFYDETDEDAILNKQHYPYLVFKNQGMEWELNGLSLDWSVKDKITNPTENDLVCAKSVIDISAFEIKYSNRSSDSYNSINNEFFSSLPYTTRYECGIKILTDDNKTYEFRLDSIHPRLLNHQWETYYSTKDAFHNTLLYAVDSVYNLDYNNTMHIKLWKKGSNPVLMQELKEWNENHPQYIQDAKKQAVNNNFFVTLNNTNNEGVDLNVIDISDDELKKLPEIQQARIKKLNEDGKKYLTQNSQIKGDIKAGGIHGARIIWFEEASRLYATDPDQTSFYPAILLSFAQAISSFNIMWYSEQYNLNILLKALKMVFERLGVKLNVNLISGKIGEIKSILSSIATSTMLLRTGQLQNLQMHELIRRLMQLCNVPLSAINLNTDGNLYLTTKKGCFVLDSLIGELFLERFSELSLKNMDERTKGEFKKYFDINKFNEWRVDNANGNTNSFELMWENTVEIGGNFFVYYQTSVNRYMGFLTNFASQEKDRKKNPKLYAWYDKYAEINPKDDADDVRRKLFNFYIQNRDNLPEDFDMSLITSNTKIKGFYSCWSILQDIEQAKKDNKIPKTEQFNKFGKGPILDFSAVERILFKQDIKKSLNRFKDILYFCFNAKITASYDGGEFVSLSNQKTGLDKITRFFVAKSKDASKVGNIQKYKLNKSSNFDEDEVALFFKDNASIWNSQNGIQTLAINLNTITKLMFNKEVCSLTQINQLYKAPIYQIDFDIEAFKEMIDKWDETRKALPSTKYIKVNKEQKESEASIPTKNALLKELAKIKNVDEVIDLDVFKDVFSTYLNFDEATKTYTITTSKESYSKITGSLVVGNEMDENGYYHGNCLINEELYSYDIDDEGQLIKNNVATGTYIDKDFYYNLALYQVWTTQKAFIKANNQIEQWFMTPEEMHHLLTQTDIEIHIDSSIKQKVYDYANYDKKNDEKIKKYRFSADDISEIEEKEETDENEIVEVETKSEKKVTKKEIKQEQQEKNEVDLQDETTQKVVQLKVDDIMEFMKKRASSRKK